jgi:hypothetical protein
MAIKNDIYNASTEKFSATDDTPVATIEIKPM